MATKPIQDELAKAKKRLETEARSFKEKGQKMIDTGRAYIERAEKIEVMVKEL